MSCDLVLDEMMLSLARSCLKHINELLCSVDHSVLLVYFESALQTQLKYFDSLFDIGHPCKQLTKSKATITEKEVVKNLRKDDKSTFKLLHGFTRDSLQKSGYNWFFPDTLWRQELSVILTP